MKKSLYDVAKEFDEKNGVDRPGTPIVEDCTLCPRFDRCLNVGRVTVDGKLYDWEVCPENEPEITNQIFKALEKKQTYERIISSVARKRDKKLESIIPIGKGDMLVRVINAGGGAISLIFSKHSISLGLDEDASAPTTDEKGLVKWWLEEGRKAYDAR